MSTTAEGARTESQLPVVARYPLGTILLLTAMNIAWRLALVLQDFNKGEYTDGILQLTVFTNRAGLYPPLFGALAGSVAALGVDLETAGRIISAVAGGLTVIPIFHLTHRAFGNTAALFAVLWYTISPLPARWSLHAMTDALFLLLCASSLSALAVAAFAAGPRERQAIAARGQSDRALAWGMLFAILATLTRYQGAGLGLVAFCVAVRHASVFRAIPWRAVVTCLFWAAVPAWIAFDGFAHTGQYRDRTTGEWISTALAYVNLAESFVLISPYYFTYPVAGLALFGVFRGHTREGWAAPLAFVLGLWALILLAAQAGFGSFQYRYMMPVLPAVLVLAGAGCAAAEAASQMANRPRLWSIVFAAGIAYTSLFTMAVLVFQRQAVGDQKTAARYVRETMSAGTPVVSNERYGNFVALGCPKMTFWLRAPVQPLAQFLPRRPGLKPEKYLPEGAIVLVSDAYGGDQMMDAVIAELNFFYRMRQYTESFPITVYPIMDDIMLHPLFNQNPLAWVLRYTPQFFSTQVYVVDRRRTDEEIATLIGRNTLPPGTRAFPAANGQMTMPGSDFDTTQGQPVLERP